MKVNRYSRPATIAKFDPLTTEDLMTVPVALQVQEDAQLDAAAEIQQKLFETRATATDSPRVNEIKSRMENEMNMLVDDISKNGVSTQNTSRLRALKSQYGKELSASGEIGQANYFAGLQAEEKKNFFKRHEDLGWDADKIKQYWDYDAASKSAFEEDGSFKTTYDSIGLPEYLDASEELQNFKDIGKTTKMIGGVATSVSNEAQVDAAIDSILAKYKDESSKEYRSMIVQGKTIEQIEDNLRATGEAMKSGLTGTPPKPKESDAAKAARKKEEEAAKKRLKTADMENETVLTSIGARIFEAGEDISNITDLEVDSTNRYNDLMDARERNDPEAERAAETAWMEAEDREYKLKNNVIQSNPNAKKLDDRANELLKSIKNGESYKILTDPAFIASYDEDHQSFAMTGRKGNFYDNIPLEDREAAQEYIKVTHELRNEIDSFLEQGKKKIVSMELIEASDKTNKENLKSYSESLGTSIKADPSSFDVNAIVDIGGDSEETPTWHDGSQEDDEAKMKEYGDIVRQNADSIKIVAMQPATDSSPPLAQIEVTVPIPDAQDGEPKKKQVYAWVSQSKNATATGKSFFTTKLLEQFNNKELRALGQSNADTLEYKDVIPAPSYAENRLWVNTDDIKAWGNSEGRGAKFKQLEKRFSNNAKYDIYKDSSGNYRLAIGKPQKQEDGKTYTTKQDFTMADLIGAREAAKEDGTLEAANDSKAMLYIGKYIRSLPGFPKQKLGQTAVEYEAEKNLWINDAYNSLKASDEPIMVQNYHEIFSMLE